MIGQIDATEKKGFKSWALYLILENRNCETRKNVKEK